MADVSGYPENPNYRPMRDPEQETIADLRTRLAASEQAAVTHSVAREQLASALGDALAQVTALTADLARCDDESMDAIHALRSAESDLAARTAERDEALRRVVEANRPAEVGGGASVPISQTRLFDLVRYQRNELLDTGLITVDEWTWLVSSDSYSPHSPRRLELYDRIAAELEQADAARDAAMAERDSWRRTAERLEGEKNAALEREQATVAAVTAERDEWMASSAGYGSDMVEWKVRAQAAEQQRDTAQAALDAANDYGAGLFLALTKIAESRNGRPCPECWAIETARAALASAEEGR